MDEQPDLVWTLLASLLIGNTLLLVLNLPLAPMWAKLLRLPRPYLYAGILFFASLGAYAANLQAFDLFLLLVFGLLGFTMRRFALPVLPLILGVILGPLMETEVPRGAVDLGRRSERAVQRAPGGHRVRPDRPAGGRADRAQRRPQADQQSPPPSSRRESAES